MTSYDRPTSSKPRRRGPRPTQSASTPSSNRSTPAAPPASVPAAPAGPVETSFTALGVPQRLADVLASQGITSAFPIQSATLPDSLAGRDVLGRGRTGSGKTIAFCLPLVTRLSALGGRPRAKHPRALVLLPTRELATQVHTALAPLAAAAGLTTTTVFGGVSQRPQVAALARGVDVLVACPGRLEDLMNQGLVRLDDVVISVLDEADHMADLGFLPGVKRILDRTATDGQRLLFSATLDNGVDVLVRRYLTNPVTHSVDDDPTTEPDMEHHVLTVSNSDKPGVVRELASGQGRSVLFMRTKHGARKLAKELTQAGVPAVDLHGNLNQNARDRNLAQFRDGRVRVLVATDVAARGIHVDDVALVVHVDPPAEHKAYLHRSGRTARAGASGVVVTVQTDAQRSDVSVLTRRAGITPTIVRVSPGAPELLSLTGPRAEYVVPSAVPRNDAGDERQQRNGSRNGGGPRNGSPRGGSAGGRQGRSGSTRSSSSSSSSPSSSTPRSGGQRSQRAGSSGTRTLSVSQFSSGSRRGGR